MNTLFGPEEEIAAPPVDPPPDHLVRRLVDGFGWSESAARNLHRRQAFAVLKNLELEKAATPAAPNPVSVRKDTSPPPPASPAPGENPRADYRGATRPEWWANGAELRAAALARGRVDRERLCRMIVAALYCLPDCRVRRLAADLGTELEGGPDGRERVSRTGGPDAVGPAAVLPRAGGGEVEGDGRVDPA